MALGTLTIDLAANVARLQSDLGRAARINEKHAADMQRRWQAASRLVGAAVAAVATGAFAAWIKSSIDAAAQLQQLSNVAGASTDQFQAWSFGARMVGIENEKLSDILKDVNDKVGDFMSTGGGMADFFENIAPKVGVTAAQFRNLSGPDALQLYVTSLDKANLSQADMTFYMEAIASDATALLPLLRDNGAGMAEYANQAQRLGLILSSETIVQAQAFNQQLTTLSAITDNVGSQIAAEMLPSLSEMAGLLIDFSQDAEAASVAAEAFGFVLRTVASIAIGVSTTFANVGRAIGGLAAAAAAAASGEFSAADEIINKFTADNEAATAKAEERLSKLWSGEFAQSGQQAAALLGQMQRGFEGTAAATGKASEATKEVTDAITSQIAALQLQAATVGMSTAEATLFKLALDGATGAQLELARAALDTVSAFDEQQRAMQEQQQLMQAIADVQRSTWSDASKALDEYQQKVETLRRGVIGGLISEEEAERTIAGLDAQLLKTEEVTDQMSEFGRRAAQNMQDAFADFLFDPFSNGLDGMLDGFLQMLQKMIAQAIAADVFAAMGMGGSGGNVAGLASGISGLFGGGSGGNVAGLASGISGLFGGGLAVGGPAQAGKLYEVGENNTPELFVSGGRQYMIPGNSGSVIPASGGGGVTQVFNITTPDPNAFRVSARQIARRAREANAIL